MRFVFSYDRGFARCMLGFVFLSLWAGLLCLVETDVLQFFFYFTRIGTHAVMKNMYIGMNDVAILMLIVKFSTLHDAKKQVIRIHAIISNRHIRKYVAQTPVP